MDITQILHDWGLQSERLIDFLSTLITLAIIALCAWLSYFLVKKWIGRFILWMVHRTRFRWDSLMFDRTFFSRLGLLVAPNVVLGRGSRGSNGRRCTSSNALSAHGSFWRP